MITEPFQNPACMISFRLGLGPACPQHALLQKGSQKQKLTQHFTDADGA